MARVDAKQSRDFRSIRDAGLLLGRYTATTAAIYAIVYSINDGVYSNKRLRQRVWLGDGGDGR